MILICIISLVNYMNLQERFEACSAFKILSSALSSVCILRMPSKCAEPLVPNAFVDVFG